MSQPFDFANTPITKQEILTARYKGVGVNAPFGGKYLRVTTTDGNRYVADSASGALAVLSATSATQTLSLPQETGGEAGLFTPNAIQKLEFGPGWDELGTINSNVLSIVYGETAFSYVYKNMVSVSGYPQGMVIGSGYRFGSFCNVLSTQKLVYENFYFDAGLWPALSGGNVESGNSARLGAFYQSKTSPSAANVNNTGPCGTICPLFAPPANNDNIFTNAGQSAAAIEGWGFVGEYAQQWVNVFVSKTFSSGARRNTHLG